MTKVQSALSVLLFAALAAGCASAASPTPTLGPSAVPTTSAASPTTSPTDAASASPAATMTTLGREEAPLKAGTYRLTQVAIGGPALRAMLITVPDGWNGGGPFLNRRRPGEDVPFIAIQFWHVDQVYGHPCQWAGTLFQPGPTVDDLAKALVDRPLRNATRPIDVTLDGQAGKYLEWSVPADADFSACDADEGHHDFKSWTGSGWLTNRYQQGPRQVDRLWILDVDGARLVIDAFWMPSATSQERAELAEVIKSIRFER